MTLRARELADPTAERNDALCGALYRANRRIRRLISSAFQQSPAGFRWGCVNVWSQRVVKSLDLVRQRAASSLRWQSIGSLLSVLEHFGDLALDQVEVVQRSYDCRRCSGLIRGRTSDESKD